MEENITPLETPQEETITVVNNEATKRLNEGFIADSFSTYDGCLVMVTGKKGDKTVDLIVTFDGWIEIADALKEAIEASKKAQEQAPEPSNIIIPDNIKSVE